MCWNRGSRLWPKATTIQATKSPNGQHGERRLAQKSSSHSGHSAWSLAEPPRNHLGLGCLVQMYRIGLRSSKMVWGAHTALYTPTMNNHVSKIHTAHVRLQILQANCNAWKIIDLLCSFAISNGKFMNYFFLN